MSPIAQAVFPHLNTPDTKFDKEGRYSVSLRIDPDLSDHARFIDVIERVKVASGEDDILLPIRDEVDNKNEPTGYKLVRFTSKYPPKVFCRDKKPWPPDTIIGQNSLIRVASTIALYDKNGDQSRIVLHVNAVQVIRWVEPRDKDADSYGFTAEKMPEHYGAEMPEPHERLVDYRGECDDDDESKEDENTRAPTEKGAPREEEDHGTQVPAF